MKEPILYKTLRPLIVFLVKTLYKPEIIGTENIPKDGKIVQSRLCTINKFNKKNNPLSS